jgi:glycosyltransferase involved in cell wall biosynthesis
MSPIRLSVVIPVHNEEATIPELWRRLRETLAGLGLPAEVIFVDDDSSDGSAALLQEICRGDTRVRRIRLSRRFGHQSALTAGIDHATGDAIVLMDGDLQDRPEAIPDMLHEWSAGAEVVYAIRVRRKESPLRRAGFWSFYGILSRLSGIPQPKGAGIFSLLDRRVLDVLKNMPEHNRYLPGLRAYAGFRQKGIPVERDARYSGSPRVSPLGLLRLALDGIISFSYVPIRLVTLTGLAVAGAAFFFMCVVLYKRLVSHQAIIGWASTLTAILFLGATQLITLGIVGEYIGRIYEEVKARPYYIVRERQNFD